MTIQERFEEFDAANPHVYTLFKRYAYELIRAGHKKLSANLIVNRIRWESATTTTGSGWHVTAGKPFLINDNFSNRYARKFVADFPKLMDRFEFREIRTP